MLLFLTSTHRAVRYFLLFVAFSILSGCAISSMPFQERVDRTDGFDQDALEAGGLAVLPVLADSAATEYRSSMLEGFHQEMSRLAPEVATIPSDSVRLFLQTDGRAQTYRDAFRVYRRTGILDEDLFVAVANDVAGKGQPVRYLLIPYLIRPLEYFSSGVEQHSDPSTRLTIEGFGIVWDARTKTVVWDAKFGAGSQTNFLEIHGDSFEEISRKTGTALARSLLGQWTVMPPPARPTR